MLVSVAGVFSGTLWREGVLPACCHPRERKLHLISPLPGHALGSSGQGTWHSKAEGPERPWVALVLRSLG